MSTIKAHNKNTDSWDIVASNKATQISTVNPKLLDKEENITSVDKVLERHEDKIQLLQHNVSWLAKHGGGGSGGSSGPDVSEAPCEILVNDKPNGESVILDSQGLKVKLDKLKVELPGAWSVQIRIGATQVARTNLTYTTNTAFLPTESISKYLTNHKGYLSVSAVYSDELNGVYGVSSWSGQIIESSINLETSDYSFASNNIKDAHVVYNYSAGIPGDYILNIQYKSDSAVIVTKEFPINIPTTSKQTKVILVKDIIDPDQLVGVYTVVSDLRYKNDQSLHTQVENTFTVVSDTINIATTEMSTNKDAPTEISASSSIHLAFTAYLQNSVTYRYKVNIGDHIIRAETTGYFDKPVNEYIPINTEWAPLDQVLPLVLTVYSGSQVAQKTFYIKVIESPNTFLTLSEDAQTRALSDFRARDYNTGISNFDLVYPNYIQGGTTYSITSSLRTINPNGLSTIKKLNNGLPFLRLSNGTCGVLDSWTYNKKTYSLSELIDTSKNFTISICFKADYHPDDNRTILFSGVADNDTGRLIKGVSIDVHDIYVNNKSVAKLTDNTINSVDVTCQEINSEIIDQFGSKKTVIEYIVKVYVDGVLTSVSREPNLLALSEDICVGARRIFNSNNQVEYIYNTDCNIYNLQVYDTVLSDFDITLNHINNVVSTSYVDNKPDFSIIASELKSNFCSREVDGSVTSLMFNDGAYTADFLLTGNKLDKDKLYKHASVMGLPVMLIDVSTDPDWTFDNFIKQQTAGSVNLDQTSGRTIQYWDPNGSNTEILDISDVSISLQGTSTLSDSVKNLNITVPNDTIFIPKSTWFPEQTYTLKADVVDSSHSNNAAIGTFINEKLGYQEDGPEKGSSFFPFDPTAIKNVYESNYKETQHKDVTLKHTVEGFPIFLIMHFHTKDTGGSSSDSNVSITPLGIYSFNIGRDAYRNLGFRQVNKITDSTGQAPSIDVFPYLIERGKIDETDSGANWIEIKDTTSLKDLISVTDKLPDDFDSSKGDFWQDDPSILDARYEVRYGGGAENKTPSSYPNFVTFVKNIMSLPIEGCATTDILGNRYEKQITGKYALYEVDEQSRYTKKDGPSGINTIITDVNSLTPDLGFNVEAAYKYFVIGLLFGLIDNFGKNSTYRSWNNGQYYVDFYDLDCALGGDNQGGLTVTPDLWIKYLFNDIQEGQKFGYIAETFDPAKTTSVINDKNTQIGSYTVVSANHNKLWLSLDTPLFRAKEDRSNLQSAYTYFWYQLRAYLEKLHLAAGYSNFADYFVDEYFIKQTKDCGSLLFNYDYKLKYLLQFNTDTYQTTKDLSKLHGRKISLVRDWLSKHINFMDTLFYWKDNSQSIPFKNDVASRASNTVLNTPESLPMKTNAPIVMYHSIGDATKTFYFMPAGTKTYVNTIGNSSNSPLTWNFSNSPNVIEFGDSSTPLASMNVRVLSATANSNNVQTTGLPAITSLLLNNNNAFDSTFNLDAFSRGPLSELRVLDLSNTKGLRGSQFALNLVSQTSTGETFTKFSKLTTIDISNSQCVSDITIPVIPLKKLALRNSSITSLNLIKQEYIKTVDITGCLYLTDIKIHECNNYETVVIKDLSNLKSISIANCAKIPEIYISNCRNLSSINIEFCDTVSNININSCPKLVGRSGEIKISNCKNLKSLDLSNNAQLEKVILTGIDRSKITKLWMHNTKIIDLSDDIKFDSSGLLNLRKFTNLTDHSWYLNPNVKKIAFTNDIDRPIPITKSFQGCKNLERVYGNIKLYRTGYDYNDVLGAFNGCTNFSIHEPDIVSWKGFNVKKNGVYQTPWSLLTNNNPEKFDSLKWEDLFSTGDFVTNIQFGNGTNLLSGLFRYSNVTDFDVYYILCAFALSRDVVELQSLSTTFYNLSNTLFDGSTGNHPDRYMFYKCEKIDSLDFSFTTSGKSDNSIILYSPDIDDEGNVIEDNGLFSPLVNLRGYWSAFGLFRCSRHILRRKNKLPYSRFTTFYGFTPLILLDSDKDTSIDNTNCASKDVVLKNYKTNNFGDFSVSFECLPNMSVFSGSFNTRYIDFSTLKFGPNLNRIEGSFKSDYGSGTFDLEDAFALNNKCEAIINSFIVETPINNEKITFPIKATTFKNLSNLQYIGYNPKSGWSKDEFSSSFNGPAFDKIIVDPTFPIDIVSKLKRLVIFSGFFKDTRAPHLIEEPKLPGNMFISNTELTDTSCLFYNANFPFSLTGNSFRNCPKLSKVSHMFYHDMSRDKTKRSQLHGQIPYKMFYHGHSEVPLTLYGSDQEEMPDKETFDESTLQQKTINVIRVNNNITNMSRCFHGCVNLSHYIMPEEAPVETNPNYSPFKWMYKNGTWYKGNDSFEIDASWSHDGSSPKTHGYKYIDSADAINKTYISGKTEILNYMCPPDLFRYCKNATTVQVYGVFENCGLNYGGSYNSSGWQGTDENIYSIGIDGRIPPYLLRPISNVSNINGMFANCKRLNSYLIGSTIYQVPRDFFEYAPNVSSLAQTFKGLSFQPKTVLDIFGPLKRNKLDIRGIFSNCVWGPTNVSEWTVSSIFRNNYIQKMSGAFSFADIVLIDNVNNLIGARDVEISMDSSNRGAVKFANNFDKSKIPESSMIGYVYSSWPKDRVVEDSIDLGINKNVSYK